MLGPVHASCGHSLESQMNIVGSSEDSIGACGNQGARPAFDCDAHALVPGIRRRLLQMQWHQCFERDGAPAALASEQRHAVANLLADDSLPPLLFTLTRASQDHETSCGASSIQWAKQRPSASTPRRHASGQAFPCSLANHQRRPTRRKRQSLVNSGGFCS